MKILLTRCDVGGALLLMLILLPGCQAAPGTEVAVFASGKPKSEVRLKSADDGRTVRDGWYRSWHENAPQFMPGDYVLEARHELWGILHKTLTLQKGETQQTEWIYSHQSKTAAAPARNVIIPNKRRDES